MYEKTPKWFWVGTGGKKRNAGTLEGTFFLNGKRKMVDAGIVPHTIGKAQKYLRDLGCRKLVATQAVNKNG